MKKITIILILIIINIFLFSNVALAYNLELILSADKTDVKVGDTVTVTLTLSKGMQAADFAINYDSNLLEFKSTSLGENFYRIKEPGKIVCSWFDTNDTINFTFTFTAISSGTAKFTTETENFYDGNLKSASSYNEGSLNITLLSSNSSIGNIVNTSNNTPSSSTQGDDIPNITPIPIEQKKEENKTISNSSTNNEQKLQTTIIQNNSETKTSANNTLPKTGSSSTIFIVISAVVLFAIIIKIKLNTLKDI